MGSFLLVVSLIKLDNAVIIGKVVENKNSLVIVKSQIGSKQILDLGEQLSRIC